MSVLCCNALIIVQNYDLHEHIPILLWLTFALCYNDIIYIYIYTICIYVYIYSWSTIMCIALVVQSCSICNTTSHISTFVHGCHVHRHAPIVQSYPIYNTIRHMTRFVHSCHVHRHAPIVQSYPIYNTIRPINTFVHASTTPIHVLITLARSHAAIIWDNSRPVDPWAEAPIKWTSEDMHQVCPSRMCATCYCFD